jgi:group I intron endonuclease
MKEKKWCVYKHEAPNGKVYIGITSQSTSRRWRTNGEGYYQDTQKKFRNAINKYGWDNFKHEIIEDNISSLEEANARERYWISFYDSYHNGYNSTLGGDASGTKKHSKEFIEFLKKQKYNCHPVEADGVVFKTIKECAEHYNIPVSRMSSWLNKRANMPKEFIDINLHYVNKPDITYIQSVGHGKQRGKHNFAKKVLCDDILFECIRDCADYYGVNPDTMSQWLCKHKMPKKFLEMKLHYVGDNSENFSLNEDRRILQFDKSCVLIKKWDSVSDASRFFKCAKANLYSALKRKAKTSCGYIWRYEDDCDDISNYVFIERNIKCGAESHNAVKINQYKEDGTFIKTWDCIQDASNYYNVASKSIGSVLDESKHRKCKGFQWRRYDEFKDCYDIEKWENKYTSSHCMKKVEQYDLENNLVCIYCSIKEASNRTKINESSISGVCRGKQKTAGGYIWKYAS